MILCVEGKPGIGNGFEFQCQSIIQAGIHGRGEFLAVPGLSVCAWDDERETTSHCEARDTSGAMGQGAERGTVRAKLSSHIWEKTLELFTETGTM